MSAIALPTEIWLAITAYVDRAEYRSLVLVCRNFHNIFTNVLYSSLVITYAGSDSTKPPYTEGQPNSQPQSKANATGETASLLLKRLETDATLRNVVRAVHIKNLRNSERPTSTHRGNDPNDVLYDASVKALVFVLARLPLLQLVKFTDSEVRTRWIIHLASHSARNLDLILTNVSLYGKVKSVAALPATTDIIVPPGSSVIPTGVTIRTLSLQSSTVWHRFPKGLAHFLSSPSLRTLDIGKMGSGVLKAAFGLLGGTPLPHLQSLTIPYLSPDEVDVLSALVNLKELKVRERHSLFGFGPVNIPPNVLRRLEIISLPSKDIPTFTAGRKITSISTEGPLETGGVNLASAGLYFGSDAMVRTVDWALCDEWDELLDHLITKNLGVWHLAIDPLHGPTSELEILPCISKLAQFRELRTLKFKTLTHIPSDRTLCWEKEQCEYLKSVGSPFLESISFSELITWMRHPDDETLWRPSGAGMETVELKLQFSG